MPQAPLYNPEALSFKKGDSGTPSFSIIDSIISDIRGTKTKGEEKPSKNMPVKVIPRDLDEIKKIKITLEC